MDKSIDGEIDEWMKGWINQSTKSKTTIFRIDESKQSLKKIHKNPQLLIEFRIITKHYLPNWIGRRLMDYRDKERDRVVAQFKDLSGHFNFYSAYKMSEDELQGAGCGKMLNRLPW